MSINKIRLARQFSRSAAAYNQAARVQAQAGEILLQLLPRPEDRVETLADLGCGTGALTSRLTADFPGAHCIGVDIAQGMIRQAKYSHPGDYICADIEQLPFPSASFDLIISSSALQWTYLPAALAEIQRVLRPRASAVLGLFVQGTLDGWQRAMQDTPFAGLHSLPSAAEVELQLGRAGLALRQARSTDLYQEHASAAEMLASVKQIGGTWAGLPQRRGLTGRGHWQNLMDKMQREYGSTGYFSKYCLYCVQVEKLADA